MYLQSSIDTCHSGNYSINIEAKWLWRQDIAVSSVIDNWTSQGYGSMVFTWRGRIMLPWMYQGLIYPMVWQPGTSKTASWASGFGLSFLQSDVLSSLKIAKFWMLDWWNFFYMLTPVYISRWKVYVCIDSYINTLHTHACDIKCYQPFLHGRVWYGLHWAHAL